MEPSICIDTCPPQCFVRRFARAVTRKAAIIFWKESMSGQSPVGAQRVPGFSSEYGWVR